MGATRVQLGDLRYAIAWVMGAWELPVVTIEQYWGAVKLLYRSGPQLKKMDKMEKQVVACLDDIPLLQIQKYRFQNYI